MQLLNLRLINSQNLILTLPVVGKNFLDVRESVREFFLQLYVSYCNVAVPLPHTLLQIAGQQAGRTLRLSPTSRKKKCIWLAEIKLLRPLKFTKLTFKT